MAIADREKFVACRVRRVRSPTCEAPQMVRSRRSIRRLRGQISFRSRQTKHGGITPVSREGRSPTRLPLASGNTSVTREQSTSSGEREHSLCAARFRRAGVSWASSARSGSSRSEVIQGRRLPVRTAPSRSAHSLLERLPRGVDRGLRGVTRAFGQRVNGQRRFEARSAQKLADRREGRSRAPRRPAFQIVLKTAVRG